MSKIKRLPDAELEIMNALWDADAPLTAAELETALPGPPRARTACAEPQPPPAGSASCVPPPGTFHAQRDRQPPRGRPRRAHTP